jgi:hypothetical protein
MQYQALRKLLVKIHRGLEKKYHDDRMTSGNPDNRDKMCLNTEGSFECIDKHAGDDGDVRVRCPTGYDQTPQGECSDINECESGENRDGKSQIRARHKQLSKMETASRCGCPSRFELGLLIKWSWVQIPNRFNGNVDRKLACSVPAVSSLRGATTP